MAVASSTAALLGAAVTFASTAVGTWSAVSRQEEQRKQEKQRTAPPDKPTKIPLLFTHVFCPYASCRTASSTICCCCVTAS